MPDGIRGTEKITYFLKYRFEELSETRDIEKLYHNYTGMDN